MKLKSIIRNSICGSLLNGITGFYKRYFVNYRKLFGYCDPSATVTKPLYIVGPENVYLYEDTKITDATIMTPVCKFVMKKHSSAANHLTVITGNHERIPGRFFRSITQQEKNKGYDEGVTIEEDCWLGVNVTLLMGVVIRRGSTIAAGAVVSKSTPPYSISGGVPAKFIKFYWTIDEIIEHESKLYPEKERYTREQLEFYFNKYNNGHSVN